MSEWTERDFESHHELQNLFEEWAYIAEGRGNSDLVGHYRWLAQQTEGIIQRNTPEVDQRN